MLRTIKQIGKAICYVLLMLGVQILAAQIFGFVYSFKIGIEIGLSGSNLDMQAVARNTQMFVMEHMDCILLIYEILTLLILFVFFKIRKKNFANEVSIKPFSKKLLFPVVLIGVCSGVLIAIGLDLLPIPQQILEAYEQSSFGLAGNQSAVMIIATVILGPIVEEVIFRGLVLSRLRCVFPASVAVIFSSVLFGLTHGQLLWMAYAFLLGILLSAIAVKTGSILPSLCVHISFNLVGSFINRLSISGIVELIVWIAALILIVTLLWFVLRRENIQTLPNSTE